MTKNGNWDLLAGDIQAQKQTIKELSTFIQQASLLMGIPMGLLMGFGPKLVSVIGHLGAGLGLTLLFLQSNTSLYYVAAICLGTAYQALTLCKMSVSTMFPGYEGVIISVIGGCADASAMALDIANDLSATYGARAVIHVLILAMLAFVLVDAVTVPSETFTVDEESLPLSHSDNDLKASAPSPKPAPLSYLTMAQAAASPYFLFTLVYAVTILFRRIHYNTNLRDFYMWAVGADGIGVTNFHNKWYPKAAPFAAISWGFMADKIGIGMAMVILNALGIVALLLPLTGQPKPAYTASMGMIVFLSFLMGSLRIYLSTVFGYKLMGILVGICESRLLV
eukprot:GHVU01192608.1.p1 GENE.GHVU01192608.1~~GHVU01192608.1.p1  ORF type:complete len:337 (-),score=13.79 GHVU01192608.1:1026-2036(-)